MCKCVCACIHACVYVCVCVFVSVCMLVCVCAYMHVCVCVSVSVCVLVQFSNPPSADYLSTSLPNSQPFQDLGPKQHFSPNFTSLEKALVFPNF